MRLKSFRYLHLVRGTNGTGCVSVSIRQLRGESGKEARHTVDLHLAMSDDLSDHALLLEVGQALSCKRSVDLHSVDEGSDGDETV